MRRSFRTRVRFFDFSGVARVVMPLTGGGVAMGERGGGWRESIGKFDYERPVRKVGMVFALG